MAASPVPTSRAKVRHRGWNGTRRAATLALAVLAACVTHTRRVGVPGAQPVAAGLPGQMQALARQALTLDPPGVLAPAQLYGPDAPALADRRLGIPAPRVTRVGDAGQLARSVASARPGGHV